MVVFKHNHVVQGKPVILSSTQFHGPLLCNAETRRSLRVSSILVFVPSSNLTKLLVLVAMADIRCIEFKTILSAFKIDLNYLKHETPHHHI
jgi:hypothetical protein